MTAPLIDVADLTKVFANPGDGMSGGVREASFTLAPGTFFTLLGPSGCGKTTTLRCIAGLEQPDRGTVRVGEQIFFDAARRISVPLNRRNIGMVFQSYAIWPHMSVFENVAFPLRVAKDRRYGRAEIERIAGAALATVDLDGFQSRPATRLSGGQQQRVALARAIVRQPKLLLLDEPLSNLDAALREEMRNELKRLQQQIGITTIYVTHDQAEALEMSDLVAVMNHGRVVQMGAPREIYLRPRDAFVAGFVGTTNLLRGALVERGAGDRIATVKLSDGQIVRCLAPDGAVQEIAVSVRPESIAIVADGAAVRAGCNRMAGTVVLSSFLGNMNRLRIQVGDEIMQVSCGPELHHPAGAAVALEFAFENTIAVPV